MIFKVTYQPNTQQVPTRENTQTLYVEARELIAKYTPYNVEFVQELSPAHLAYEQESNPDFEVSVF